MPVIMLRQSVTILLCGLGLAGSFRVHVPSSFPTRSIKEPSVLSMSTVAAAAQDSLPPPAAAMPGNTAEDVFDWNKQWYPVLSLKDTDTKRAHPVQLLGKDLVVWRDGQERWTCFDDRCPHRAAPLTEGRVEEDGSLLCAYHAWRFDGDGKCLSIPQSNRGGADELQPAACAKVYPTQVAQDMIWVWGENGPDAGLESALTPPTLVPELDDVEGLKSGRITVAPVGHRDVPYGWDTFMENVLDPAHVPVSHHGIVGDRYKDAKPLSLKPDEQWPLTATGGFGFINEDGPYEGSTTKINFSPPSLVINEVGDADGNTVKLILYAMPMRPGWCRMLGRQMAADPVKTAATGKEKKKRPKSVASGRAAAKVPAWLQHTLGSLFLHQDLVFLHHQEKILNSAGYDSATYGKAVFTPASADRAVLALRKWIAKHGSGGPAWDKGCDPTLPPREYNRNELFDVYEQHTKDCSSCLGALKRVEKGLKAAKAAAILSFGWALLQGARAASAAAASSSSTTAVNVIMARAMLPATVVSLASLGAIKGLKKLHGLFYTYPYHHQDNP